MCRLAVTVHNTTAKVMANELHMVAVFILYFRAMQKLKSLIRYSHEAKPTYTLNGMHLDQQILDSRL